MAKVFENSALFCDAATMNVLSRRAVERGVAEPLATADVTPRFFGAGYYVGFHGLRAVAPLKRGHPAPAIAKRGSRLPRGGVE